MKKDKNVATLLWEWRDKSNIANSNCLAPYHKSVLLLQNNLKSQKPIHKNLYLVQMFLETMFPSTGT